MLLASLNIPFDEDLCDTQIYMARIDAEVAAREFDILVLPNQPYRISPWTFERRLQIERSARDLIGWLTDLSARKHALIVCGTWETAKKLGFYRTALAAFEGRLIARHVKFPYGKALSRWTPVIKHITLIDLPHFAKEVSIVLDDDLSCPLPLMAVSRSCMSLVPCMPANTALMNRAYNVAREFGVFTVLSTYRSVEGRESGGRGSTILTPAGNAIGELTDTSSLLIAEIPDIPAWVATQSRVAHWHAMQHENLADRWRHIGKDPLNARSGFYVP
jgi:hypothetical protein